MKRVAARQVLDDLLAGGELSSDDVHELMRSSGEGLYVDFKHGAELDDPRKGAATVRRYVAGFANSDGGLLVVGVSDGDGDASKRELTDVKRPGGKLLHEWAVRVISGMAGGLSPPPRVQTVTHADGKETLLIAVARAPALIPCVEAGELTYYLRIGDSTPAIPPYLVTDLVLGRRTHPTLAVRSPRLALNGRDDLATRLARFVVDVSNEGIQPAHNVVMGVVSWGMRPRDRDQGREAAAALLSFVEVIDTGAIIDSERPVLVHLSSRRDRPAAVPAFEQVTLSTAENLLTSMGPLETVVRSALYVISDGHPPNWYQLDWTLPARGAGRAATAMVSPALGPRPVVAWGPGGQ